MGAKVAGEGSPVHPGALQFGATEGVAEGDTDLQGQALV
jgi:hypothetical protein